MSAQLETRGLSPLSPGWLDVTAEQYHALDCASSHRLGLLRRSPAHLKAEIDNPSPPTAAMILGQAVHCAVLEPERFDAEYVRAPICDRRTTKGKETWAAFVAENPGRLILDSEDYLQCVSIARAVREHDIAGEILDANSAAELSGIFPLHGVLCKMRIDAYAEEIGTIDDLKTTENASRREFERSIFAYGYHRQGALYVDGCRTLGLDVDHYTIIAVEKKAPYAVAVYRLKDDVLELGRKENKALLELYKRCLDTGHWPGYPEAIQDIGIPVWAAKQIEEDL